MAYAPTGAGCCAAVSPPSVDVVLGVPFDWPVSGRRRGRDQQQGGDGGADRCVESHRHPPRLCERRLRLAVRI